MFTLRNGLQVPATGDALAILEALVYHGAQTSEEMRDALRDGELLAQLDITDQGAVEVAFDALAWSDVDTAVIEFEYDGARYYTGQLRNRIALVVDGGIVVIRDPSGDLIDAAQAAIRAN